MLAALKQEEETMKSLSLILEVGKTYQASELTGFANSERLHDIQYFTYISFEPNSIPRKISQHYEVTADVIHYQPQTAEGVPNSQIKMPSSKPQANQEHGVKVSSLNSCGAGGYLSYSIVRIYDCTNGPFQSVQRMEFRKEGALSLVDRFRQAEGSIVRGYN